MATISVQTAVEFIRILDHSDTDFVTGISGARGLGKSTLLVRFIDELEGSKNWDFVDKLIYHRDELEHQLENNPDASNIGADEAINNLFKREWHDDNQIQIVKMLNMYRDKRHRLFMLIPHFWDLDGAVRNSLIIKWWIYVYKLGEAIVFTHDTNPFSLDPWNVKYNLWLWRKGHIWRSPNYLFNIRWKPLERSRYNEYKKVKGIKRRKAEKRQEIEDAERLAGLTKKQQVIVAKRMFPDLTGYAISKKLDIDKPYVYKVIEEAGLKS